MRIIAGLLVASLSLVPFVSGSALDGALGGPSCEEIDGSTTCECGGTDSGACSTGTHAFLTLVQHSCVGEAGFTGAIQSVIQHPDGARVFTCVYDAGNIVQAYGVGPFPTRGLPFTQYCDAVGTGPWSCWVTWS